MHAHFTVLDRYIIYKPLIFFNPLVGLQHETFSSNDDDHLLTCFDRLKSFRLKLF